MTKCHCGRNKPRRYYRCSDCWEGLAKSAKNLLFLASRTLDLKTRRGARSEKDKEVSSLRRLSPIVETVARKLNSAVLKKQFGFE